MAQSSASLSVERLIDRGDDLLARRDVTSARLLYELAASEGSARAAALVAVTYDPWTLKQRGVQGKFADAGKAADWYRAAIKSGYAKANIPLKRLLTKAEPKSSIAERKAAKPEGAGLKEPEGELLKPVIPKPEASELVAATPGKGAGGAYWIQLASLSTRDYANKELVRILESHAALIGNKSLILKRRVLSGGSKIMYGIQTGPFADRPTAEVICNKLKSERQDCFVLP